jgi:hypothetical protein
LIVAFDASTLVYVFNEKAGAPPDPKTGQPVTRCADRIRFLLQTIEREKGKIVIPTPALAEVLVKAEKAAPDYLAEFDRNRHFKLVGFDKRAMIEFVAMERERLGDAIGSAGSPKPKAKFDQQIVAIAKVENANTIYSDDEDVRKLATRHDIEVVGIAQLPLPPEEAQGRLPLESKGDGDD